MKKPPPSCTVPQRVKAGRCKKAPIECLARNRANVTPKLRRGDRFIPVVRRLESKFRKPAHGSLTSTFTPPETLDQLRADLAAKGRAIVSVPVELHAESGTHTLSATVEWFITKLP